MTVSATTLNLTASPVGKGEVSAAYSTVKPTVAPDIDMLDPEAMMAFFGQQMSNVRGQLTVAMKGQEDRNTIITKVQTLEAKLAAFQDNGIKPGDASWNDFAACAKEVQGLLGGKAGQDIQAMLDKATKSESKTIQIDDLDDALNAGATFVALGPGAGQAKVTAPVGLDKNDVQSLSGSLKAYRDGLTNDNAMNMISIQSLVEKSSQLTTMCSNLMKKLDDMKMASIENMK